MAFHFFRPTLNSSPSSRAGFSLVEVAIVMGVVAMVMAGLWVAVSSVWLNYDIHRTQNQVYQIVQNFRDLYSNRGWPWGNGDDITDILKGGGEDTAYPQDVWSGVMADSVIHSFGEPIVIRAFNDNVGGALRGRRIQVNLTNLRADVCAQFIVKTPVLVKEAGIVWISGPSGGRDINLMAPVLPDPISVAEATAWCDRADKTNFVRIEFKAAN